jgi:hypothetical protein
MAQLKITGRNQDLNKICHRRQACWQILIPLGLILLAGLAVTVLLSLNAGKLETLDSLAHTSTVLLVIPLIFLLLVILVTTIALIILIHQITKHVPKVTAPLRVFFNTTKNITATGADGITSPVIKINQSWAVISRLIKIFFNRKR